VSERPDGLMQLQHVALNVPDVCACERFYRRILGMQLVWRPDEGNVYLTNGTDNLALHHAPAVEMSTAQRLDHLGFSLAHEGDVDTWDDYLTAQGVPIVAAPRTHRDGARSLYCEDPAGNIVQLLHDPRVGRR